MAEAAKKATTKATNSKNLGGRPLVFKTTKELQAAIDEYFAWCDNRVRNVYIKEAGDNVPISDPAPYTMSGLALALGIDRRTLLDYSKREGFFPLVKAARLKVENDVETRLMEGKNQAGAIFNLKNNFDWRDKTEQEVRVDLPTPILGGLTQASKDGDAIPGDHSDS